MFKKILGIYLTFLQIGALAFGGGYTILVLIQKILCEKKKWLSQREVTDYFAISQSLPGIISISFSAFVGYKRAKVPGVVAAVLGILTVPVILVMCLAQFMSKIADFPTLETALKGLSIAVCAMIISVALKMYKKSVRSILANIICVATTIVYVATPISPVVPLVMAGFTGFLYYKVKKKVFRS